MTPSPYQYFSMEELACKHCGQMHMDNGFMAKLVSIRRELGFPLPVTSGYRCPEHNAAVSDTGKNGPHTTGRACDIAISGERAYRLLRAAVAHGITGIGIKQHGTSRYVHLDDLDGQTRPWIWSYT